MKQNSLAKSAFYKFVLNFFNIVLPVVIAPYILRVIGPTNLGKVQYSLNIMGYFLVFSTFGIYQFGIREVSKCREDKKKLNELFSNLMVISIITSTITIIVFLTFITFKYRSESIYILLLLCTIEYITNAFYVEWITEGLEQFGFITKKTIVLRTIYAITLLLLVKSPEHYVIYLILLIATNFFNNFISFIYIRRYVKFTFKNIKILRYIAPLFYVLIMNNTNILYTQFDKTLLGQQNIVYFTTAQTIVMAVFALSNTLIQVTIPRISSVVDIDKSRFEKILEISTKINFVFVIPMAVGLIAIAGEIINLYAGSNYSESISILKAFGVYLVILIAENITSNQIMYPYNKEKVLIKHIFVGGILNVALDLILFLNGYYSGFTTVITTLLANFIVVLLNYIYIVRELKIKLAIFTLSTIKYLIGSLTFFIVAHISRLLFNSNVVVACVTIVGSAIIYGVMLLVTKDDTLNMILSKFKIKK